MKKISIIASVVFTLMVSTAFAGSFPTSIAGLTLGEHIDKHDKYCETEEATPIPDTPFLKEVHFIPGAIPGVRGGSLTYANCEDVDTLMRVKLKFHNRSQRFFDRLYRKYEKAYGKPDSYEGDTFRNIVAWKWVFTRGDERMSILLMWSKKAEMRPGVSIKMTYDSIMENEYQCYMKQQKEEERREGDYDETTIDDIDDFVAR